MNSSSVVHVDRLADCLGPRTLGLTYIIQASTECAGGLLGKPTASAMLAVLEQRLPGPLDWQASTASYCPVCLEEPHEAVTLDACGHSFWCVVIFTTESLTLCCAFFKSLTGAERSLACICTWRERKRTCPLCKATYGAVLASGGEAVSAAVSSTGLSRFTAFGIL